MIGGEEVHLGPVLHGIGASLPLIVTLQSVPS
jgi:hypothetical protein